MLSLCAWFLICYHSEYTHIIERHIQQCLNKLSDWADTNGFKFSSSETVCMHFCRLHKLQQDPVLTLNGSPIPVVEETKFLGIIFHRKLSFLLHIRHLKEKCTKALNLLRDVAHTTWGADQQYWFTPCTLATKLGHFLKVCNSCTCDETE